MIKNVKERREDTFLLCCLVRKNEKKLVYFPLIDIEGKSKEIKSNITSKFFFVLKSYKIILINLKPSILSYYFSLQFEGKIFMGLPQVF